LAAGEVVINMHLIYNFLILYECTRFSSGPPAFLNSLLILCYEVCVEVSPLCSLATTVCAAVDSVVYQIALLPSNNSLCSGR